MEIVENLSENLTRFRSSIRKGTGRAFLMARQSFAVGYTDEIISACLKNYAYDGQSENSRAPYLFQLALLSGEIEKIKQAVIYGLQHEVEDTWTLTQLFDLAFLFAKKGDSRFREEIYQRFFQNQIPGSDWVGYREIVNLDGLSGLKHIATVMGRELLRNPESWQDDTILAYFSETYPDIDGRSELENATVNSPEITGYLAGVDKTTRSRLESRGSQRSFTTLLEEIKAFRVPVQLRKRTMSERDLRTVAEALVNETNTKHLESMLAFFGYFKFPLEVKYLLDLARRRRSLSNSVAWRAIRALTLLQSGEVRAFAIQRLKRSSRPEDFADLLIANYRQGDGALLERIAANATSDDAVESLGRSYGRIYDENVIPESSGPLLQVYRKMTCGNCRQMVVAAMVKNGVVPEKVFEEISYDCNPDTAKLSQVGI